MNYKVISSDQSLSAVVAIILQVPRVCSMLGNLTPMLMLCTLLASLVLLQLEIRINRFVRSPDFIHYCFHMMVLFFLFFSPPSL